ncbi:MAG: cytochrome c [Acidobacteria bacterium]|nr:cytochrome c [Acidobacteriota bacterium]
MALPGFGCSNQRQSVVTNNGDLPSASVSPSPDLSPTAVRTQPAPTGQPLTPQVSQENAPQKSIASLPPNLSTGRPMMTPTPDPFPPRPTPTVVMKDGKILQEWQAPAEAANIVNPFKNKSDAAKIGREYYMQRCAACHGQEGKGNGIMSKTLLKPPTNLASQMVQANSDGELFWKITNGKSPMPANRIRFNDDERWYIVAYLRTLK